MYSVPRNFYNVVRLQSMKNHIVPSGLLFAKNSNFRTIVTQLSPTTSLLRADESDNEVYLIGTAHISDQSAKEVKDLINVVKPGKVFIELCPPRANRLRQQQQNQQQNNEEDDPFQQTIKKALNSFSSSRGMMIPGGEEMIGAAFTGFYSLLKKYGYFPGVEMLAAMEEADRIGAKLYFGDQGVDETLRKLKNVFQPSMLMKAMTSSTPQELQEVMNESLFSDGGGVGNAVEALKTRENAKLMTEWISTTFPPIADVMIHQRDTIMAQNLRVHCGKGKIVAVVGLAHMDGIEREWGKKKKKGAINNK